MRILSLPTLRSFWHRHAAAKAPLQTWYREASNAQWETMNDVKQTYPHASILDSERVVFNIGGNKYRLVVKVWFPGKQMYIKFIGTHREYDDVDVKQF